MTLSFAFLENETEVSFFSRQLYEQFKVNPEVGDHRFPKYGSFADDLNPRSNGRASSNPY